jgi:glycosyltransferase involved in cell wall biosynthesis
MDQPLVSIIMPAFNAARHIRETLDNVVDQSYGNWECIIVNDGSTDDTQGIIETLIQSDSRFNLINTVNSGVSSARNTAVAHARGTYLFPLDADDKIHPECISRCVGEFENKPGLKLVYPQGLLFGSETGPWELPPFNYKTMLKYNMIHNSSLFLKKDFDRVGGYRTNMVHGLEDWDFFIALLHGCTEQQVVKLAEPLFYYRVNKTGRRLTVAADSRQRDMLDQMVYNNFNIYREYFPDIFSRIHEYEFDKKMLSKGPVKLVVNTLIRLSALRNKWFGNKN